MRARFALLIAFAASVAVAAGGYAYWRHVAASRLPEYVAWGNGRIEGEEVHVATKLAGRIAAVLVDEGDLVKAGQVLARMDTDELEAALARARAGLESAQHAVQEAKAQIAQADAAAQFAKQELERAIVLGDKGFATKERLDQRRTEDSTARAAQTAAHARLNMAEHAIEASSADVRRIKVQIEDSVLKAPLSGRVQYKLARQGEVLGAGGKVVTLLDVTDVYMTIYLPTAQAGRVRIGADARIILDAAPQYVIPAKISFVASDAQFTPREVETQTERAKLMFRVKVKIDPDLLRAHLEKVKTGLPGEAFVLLGPNVPWPKRLEVKLPPPEA